MNRLVLVAGIWLSFGVVFADQKAPLKTGESISPDDPIAKLVGRLELERYKATIKELTRFGDRRQGTDRNRAAIDWIEAQLTSYGCPAERHRYTYVPGAKPAAPRGSRKIWTRASKAIADVADCWDGAA